MELAELGKERRWEEKGKRKSKGYWGRNEESSRGLQTQRGLNTAVKLGDKKLRGLLDSVEEG